jgi:pimeloyl-ACP methyl ester carboxylesterase
MEGMTNVRLHVIDKAGHLPQIDKPEEFNATVLAFLKD